MSLESFPVLGFGLIQLALMVTVLCCMGMQAAVAQPRSAAAPRQAPALPQSGHQSEAIDLNEGKTAAQMFSSDCSVCHQRPNGLAKGRSAGQLTSFLRQHYTTGTQQAGMLASYLTSDGLDRGTPAPAVSREGPERPGAGVPIVRPPASIGNARRSGEADDADSGPGGRKPPPATEASRPADREPPANRKPAREETRKPPAERQPAVSARAHKPAHDSKQSEAPTATGATPEAPAAAPAPAAPPAAEEKPAAPQPPAPEIRI